MVPRPGPRQIAIEAAIGFCAGDSGDKHWPAVACTRPTVAITTDQTPDITASLQAHTSWGKDAHGLSELTRQHMIRQYSHSPACHIWITNILKAPVTDVPVEDRPQEKGRPIRDFKEAESLSFYLKPKRPLKLKTAPKLHKFIKTKVFEIHN